MDVESAVSSRPEYPRRDEEAEGDGDDEVDPPGGGRRPAGKGVPLMDGEGELLSKSFERYWLVILTSA